MFAVGVFGREGSRRYVLSYPGRIAGAAIEDGGCGECGMKVVDWAGKAILKEAVGVDWGSGVFQRARIRGRWHWR